LLCLSLSLGQFALSGVPSFPPLPNGSTQFKKSVSATCTAGVGWESADNTTPAFIVTLSNVSDLDGVVIGKETSLLTCSRFLLASNFSASIDTELDFVYVLIIGCSQGDGEESVYNSIATLTMPAMGTGSSATRVMHFESTEMFYHHNENGTCARGFLFGTNHTENVFFPEKIQDFKFDLKLASNDVDNTVNFTLTSIQLAVYYGSSNRGEFPNWPPSSTMSTRAKSSGTLPPDASHSTDASNTTGAADVASAGWLGFDSQQMSFIALGIAAFCCGVVCTGVVASIVRRVGKKPIAYDKY